MAKQVGNGRKGNGAATSAPRPKRLTARTKAAAAKQAATATPTATTTPAKKEYFASISPEPKQPLPKEFAEVVLELEQKIGKKLCLFLQSQKQENITGIDRNLEVAFRTCLKQFPKGKQIALLIDSPGGQAKQAYSIARILQRGCGGFEAIIPFYAKSAATLLVLGADTIFMGEHCELGPLDVQIMDPEREDTISALDEVQSLERFHAFALKAFDSPMFLLKKRSNKKLKTLLPISSKFAMDMVRPLLEKIDIVQYTQMSRILKVAEQYAIRLMSRHYPSPKAEKIASILVEQYPEHGFLIDRDEARSIGLRVKAIPDEQAEIISRLGPALDEVTAYGCVITK